MPIDLKLRPWWLEPPSAEAAGREAEALGLSGAEAEARLARFGPNLFRARPDKSLLRQYLARFKNPLVIILLVASAVSAFVGEVANFLIISFIVLLSVTLDFFQEYRANAAAKKLRLSVSLRAIALRDGKPVEVAATQVVPGDVVLLSAGDLIPADGRVLDARDFFVKQALLTGESYPVEKRPGALPDSATEIQEATNAVFMGTSVISGSAKVLVIKTGAITAIGEIADSISRAPAPTSFEVGTRRFGMLIMRLTVLMVMFVLLANALFHKPWLESFLFAVALAVGLTPELLPMVISVTLSRGALRMARKQMIVKRLSAIQDLGSMDVLCTDKTGTLTEAKIRLERHVDAQGQPSERVLELAYLNSFFETGLKSPLDEAILAHTHIEAGAWKKIDEVPFDFERRRVSVLIENGETRWLVVKGAPDEIVGLCTHYEAGGAENQLPIDEAALAAIHTQYRALEEEGFRALGIAWRQVPLDHPHAVVSDETELVLAGFAAFLDPPKESAGAALEALKKAGVAIKIVTGDSDLVTRHVCGQLKIPVTGLDRQGDRAAGRSRTASPGGNGEPVLPGQSIAEGPRDPGAQGPRPRSRLSGRWHQRCAIPALGGRRAVGRLGRGCGQGGGRHDPAQTGPAGDSRGRFGRAAHLRQHHEVHHDGHQFQLRQYVQHGRRRAVSAVPADVADADPAQQYSLRHIGGADSAGRSGRRGTSPPARARPEFHPQLHAGHRTDQLRVRLPHLLHPAGRVAGGREAVSDRLVRRIAMHPGAGDIHHPHARKPAEESRPSSADGNVARSGRHRRAVAVYADRNVFRICAAACQVLLHPRGDGDCLSIRRRVDQAGLLPMVSGAKTAA